MDSGIELQEPCTSSSMFLQQSPPKIPAREARNASDNFELSIVAETEEFSRQNRNLKRKKKIACSLYDECGRIRHNGLDVCDCMDDDCPGCWFECVKCGSTKCGPECRKNRNFFYESIEFDGQTDCIRNQHFPVKK
ncbi:ARL14 effector protein-like [Glossina fuscipes fuscipes]